ncbi:MAG: PEP-CTERM system histidine kinase PrsK [Acidobacteriia bacterium]|nr:PEP-CTERM system histidine kinase PrsK [Terriglobia bacterium]
MTLFSSLPFAAAIFALLLACASLLAKKRSFAMWSFFAGMVVLAGDSLIAGLSLRAPDSPQLVRWLTLGLIVKSFVPATWLGFSLAYSRGNYREQLVRWKLPLAVAYARTKFAEIDVYPSRAVLRSSLTILVAGGYLFIVGILANLVRRFGGVENFAVTTFIVLLGMAGLGALLLSDRLRQRIHCFVSLHFARAQHDSVRIWAEFSRRLANVKDQAGLCAASARLISETFEVLSVTIWLVDEQSGQLTAGASTTPEPGAPAAAPGLIAAGLRAKASPFDLEGGSGPWLDELRRLNPTKFPNGGRRWCVPLRAGERSLGVVVLADRINGAGYTAEQLQLLECIADQVTSTLLNLRLADEVARSRELEAFRTMSAFFVHDLKNAASSLNLMLKNLPVHFDNPAFREDALRGIGNSVRRIDDMIGRLTALRQRPGLNLVETDLNQLVSEALGELGAMPQVELTEDLQPVPKVLADREQIESVVTNLVMNAREAVGPGGRIRVGSGHLGDIVVLSVTDNGCGMSAAFLRDSLFRPFQSTKKKGLGVGMFQSRMIVEAHGGSIRVESETGKGSTFRVTLPVGQGSAPGGRQTQIATDKRMNTVFQQAAGEALEG